MLIQNAQKKDLPQILELQKICYRESAKRYNDFAIAPLVQTLDELEKEFEKTTILKAEKNDRIVGSVRAYEKNGTCFIGRVIVHPEFQNKGIGKNLIREIENRFSHAARYELFTGFRDKKNLHFYKSLEYLPFKEEKHNDSLTMIFLEKLSKKE
jgi:ribosomal protein S18 acetylase RimI-like enzyme